MARLSGADWLDFGLRRLAEAGPEALTIEALCAAAGKTKGSFYHHFETVESFRAALAAHWRERDTEAIIELSSQPAEAGERLGALNRLTSRLDRRLELGMRRLAAQDEAVEAACRAVDRRRIGHLIRLYSGLEGFSGEEAELLAQVTYAAFIGFQTIAPEMDAETSERAYLKFMGLVLRR
jgi:AcrR family transcriptional regulator